MADIRNAAGSLWEWLAPRLAMTLGRFPLAILLQLAATAVAIAGANQWLGLTSPRGMLLAGGLIAAAVSALAGSLFQESRPRLGLLGIILAYLLPALVGGLALAGHFGVIPSPILLLPASILWLSVSANTLIGRGTARGEAEDRFWWLNHQSAVGAAAVLTGLGAVVVGLAVIAGTLRTLFDINAEQFLFGQLLLFLGVFVGPVLWLATIPRPRDYAPRAMLQPDIVARTIGAIAQYAITPLLFVYAAILLVYLVRILFTWNLPPNTSSWMVFYFAASGAFNWLLLHPAFLRDRPLVRIFRAGWFWLTLPPLALYFLAVAIRIDSYGLTPERVMLLAGGVWAALIALVYIAGRGDIRLIPAIGAIILASISVGPLNPGELTRLNQGARLDAFFDQAGVSGFSMANPWTPEETTRVRVIFDYLFWSEDYRPTLVAVLAEHGIEMKPLDYPAEILQSLLEGRDVTDEPVPEGPFLLELDRRPEVDLGAASVYLGTAYIYTAEPYVGRDLTISIEGPNLIITSSRATEPPQRSVVELSAWLDSQDREALREPYIDFAFDGRDYRLVVTQLYVQPAIVEGRSQRQLGNLQTVLFAAP